MIASLALAAATMAIQPKVSAYDSHGRTLLYQTYGRGNSPWILLAGGPGYEPRYVAPLAGLLTSSTRRIVVLNQRGTGLSKTAAADSLQLTVDGEVADLEALRMALHLSSLHLIGHSWGGYLAMAYAAQHPSHVAAMVLLDPLGDDPRSWLPMTDEMMAALTPAERHDAQIACTSLKPGNACDMAEFPSFFYDHKKAMGFIQSIDPTGPQIDNESVNDTVTFDIMRRPHLRALHGSLIPTLLIFGAADPYRHPAQHDLMALLPHARVEIVPRAGHFTWFEQPMGFLRAVLPFLGAHES